MFFILSNYGIDFHHIKGCYRNIIPFTENNQSLPDDLRKHLYRSDLKYFLEDMDMY